MTQDIKDVLKLALEGVEIHSPNSPEYIVCAALIEALRENAMREVQRLGQEIEQEPVALPCCGYADASAVKWNPHNQVVQCHNCGQVYETPPQRKPLTDEQIEDAWRKVETGDFYDCVQPFARAIEAAHGIRD